MKKFDILKPNVFIGTKTDIQLGKNELSLFNALINVWQNNAKENLFESINPDYALTLESISKLIDVSKPNLVRNNYIEEVFTNLLKTKVRLCDCILPEINNNGNLIFENGALKFQKFSIYETNILSYWSKNKNKELSSYTYSLTPLVKGLVHFQTLLENNGIGFSRLNLKILNTIKSVKAIRLYEVLVRESIKNKNTLSMTYEEMGSLIYVEGKRKINQALKRLFIQLEHLVFIEKIKSIDDSIIYLKFKLIDQKVIESKL